MPATRALVLVTGANQGIGFATAQQLIMSDRYHVLVGARTELKAETALKDLQANAPDKTASTPLVIDVTDDESITAAAKMVSERFGRLDILINNAGLGEATGATIRDRFRQIFEVNVFGVAAVTDAFLPLMRKSIYSDRRIVNVSSGIGLITMAGEKGYEFNANAWYVPEYRSSKAALNMITVAQSVKFAADNIAVIAAAPGMCRTRFTAGQGMKDASEGAKAVVRAATEGDSRKLTGTFVADEPHSGW